MSSQPVVGTPLDSGVGGEGKIDTLASRSKGKDQAARYSGEHSKPAVRSSPPLRPKADDTAISAKAGNSPSIPTKHVSSTQQHFPTPNRMVSQPSGKLPEPKDPTGADQCLNRANIASVKVTRSEVRGQHRRVPPESTFVSQRTHAMQEAGGRRVNPASPLPNLSQQQIVPERNQGANKSTTPIMPLHQGSAVQLPMQSNIDLSSSVIGRSGQQNAIGRSGAVLATEFDPLCASTRKVINPMTLSLAGTSSGHNVSNTSAATGGGTSFFSTNTGNVQHQLPQQGGKNFGHGVQPSTNGMVPSQQQNTRRDSTDPFDELACRRVLPHHMPHSG
mmetsp:Transcript_27542/g.81021  ORF Transcript_27542/g.81021 Transcript_27542/m.81021 type:complete len:332 (-) Transcript_27542:36-1031(-)